MAQLHGELPIDEGRDDALRQVKDTNEGNDPARDSDQNELQWAQGGDSVVQDAVNGDKRSKGSADSAPLPTAPHAVPDNGVRHRARRPLVNLSNNPRLTYIVNPNDSFRLSAVSNDDRVVSYRDYRSTFGPEYEPYLENENELMPLVSDGNFYLNLNFDGPVGAPTQDEISRLGTVSTAEFRRRLGIPLESDNSNDLLPCFGRATRYINAPESQEPLEPKEEPDPTQPFRFNNEEPNYSIMFRFSRFHNNTDQANPEQELNSEQSPDLVIVQASALASDSVEAPVAISASDLVETSGAVATLEPVGASESVEVSDAVEAFESVEAFEVVETFEIVEAFESVETFEFGKASASIQTSESIRVYKSVSQASMTSPTSDPVQTFESYQVLDSNQVFRSVRASEPVRLPESVHAPELVQAPQPFCASEPVRLPQPIHALEPVQAPQPSRAPKPVRRAPELAHASEPVRLPESVHDPVPVQAPPPFWAPGLVRLQQPVHTSEPVRAPQHLCAPEPVRLSQSVHSPEPVQAPQPFCAPEPVRLSRSVHAPEPVQAPQYFRASETVRRAPELVRAPQPAHAPERVQARQSFRASKPARLPQAVHAPEPAQASQPFRAPKPVRRAPKLVRAPQPVHTPEPVQEPQYFRAPEPVHTPMSVQAPQYFCASEPVRAPELVRTPEIVRAPQPAHAPEPVQAPRHFRAPEPVRSHETVWAPQPVHAPELVQAPQSFGAPEPVRALEPIHLPEAVHAPQPFCAPELARSPQPGYACQPFHAPQPVRAPEPIRTPLPAHAPETYRAPQPIRMPEPVRAHQPVRAPQPFHAPEPVRAHQPVQAHQPVRAHQPVWAYQQVQAHQPVPAPLSYRAPEAVRTPDPVPAPEQVCAPQPVPAPRPFRAPEQVRAPQLFHVPQPVHARQPVYACEPVYAREYVRAPGQIDGPRFFEPPPPIFGQCRMEFLPVYSDLLIYNLTYVNPWRGRDPRQAPERLQPPGLCNGDYRMRGTVTIEPAKAFRDYAIFVLGHTYPEETLSEVLEHNPLQAPGTIHEADVQRLPNLITTHRLGRYCFPHQHVPNVRQANQNRAPNRARPPRPRPIPNINQRAVLIEAFPRNKIYRFCYYRVFHEKNPVPAADPAREPGEVPAPRRVLGYYIVFRYIPDTYLGHNMTPAPLQALLPDYIIRQMNLDVDDVGRYGIVDQPDNNIWYESLRMARARRQAQAEPMPAPWPGQRDHMRFQQPFNYMNHGYPEQALDLRLRRDPEEAPVPPPEAAGLLQPLAGPCPMPPMRPVRPCIYQYYEPRFFYLPSQRTVWQAFFTDYLDQQPDPEQMPSCFPYLFDTPLSFHMVRQPVVLLTNNDHEIEANPISQCMFSPNLPAPIHFNPFRGPMTIDMGGVGYTFVLNSPPLYWYGGKETPTYVYEPVYDPNNGYIVHLHLSVLAQETLDIRSYRVNGPPDFKGKYCTLFVVGIQRCQYNAYGQARIHYTDSDIYTLDTDRMEVGLAMTLETYKFLNIHIDPDDYFDRPLTRVDQYYKCYMNNNIGYRPQFEQGRNNYTGGFLDDGNNWRHETAEHNYDVPFQHPPFSRRFSSQYLQYKRNDIYIRRDWEGADNRDQN